jgi:tRNA U38,U39,U40 pseudouridine synthase TruA
MHDTILLLHSDSRSVLTKQGILLVGRKETVKEPLFKEEIQKLQPILQAYQSTDKQHELLKVALKKYEGTHPFHNFTKRLEPGQELANWYIESFRVQDPVIVDGIKWIPTQVLGQLFLLN